MKKRIMPLLIAILLCIVCAAAVADGDGIAFDPASGYVDEGSTIQTVLNRNGVAAEGELSYASSDARVASVDENGLVTGLKKGKVTITASVKTEKKTYKAAYKLTVVRPVTSIEVNTTGLPVFSVTDEKIAPLITNKDALTSDISQVLLVPVKKKVALKITALPKDASVKNTVLQSGNEEVFTVNRNAVTGVAEGEGVLTISSETNPDVNVKYLVIVIQPVKKLSVESENPFVIVGGQAKVTSKAVPDNATIQSVLWSSGDERIASIDAEGIVTGVKRGNGRIIATAEDGSNVRANFTIKVVQLPQAITLNPEELTVDVAKTAAVKCVVEPKDTDNKKVVWTSSDESVATVSRDGRIKGISVGECSVTCTSEALDSVSATVMVHVQQPVKKLFFNEKTVIAYAGEQTQLAWTIEPADATNQVLAFKSNNEKVATVDENGVVTGVGAGETKVTAVTTDGSNRKAVIGIKVGNHVSSVRMVRSHAYIDVRETASAGVKIEPADALNTNMTWVSSDDSIVKVAESGKKAKLTGVGMGNATVTGTTEDGNFPASIEVTVGNFDFGLKYLDFSFDNAGNFWLIVRNDTDEEINMITAELAMFSATGEELAPVPINTKDGSNKVNIVWNGHLQPGEKTSKKNWKMVNYSLPVDINTTRGSVVLYSYQLNNDWVKTIRKDNRVIKDY